MLAVRLICRALPCTAYRVLRVAGSVDATAGVDSNHILGLWAMITEDV
jgi:hypothetical protein